LCLESYKNCYADYEIVAVFEPRSNTSATNVLQKEFTDSLAYADRVLIAPVHRGEAYTDQQRIDSSAMVKSLSLNCLSANAYNTKKELFEALISMDRGVKRLVLLFTNGSFGEPLKEYLCSLKGK
jgi:UDP-N-acetylmuramate: L-alanyl-gamma-D-glutamyl-meso-diaminopimelate ligase